MKPLRTPPKKFNPFHIRIEKHFFVFSLMIAIMLVSACSAGLSTTPTGLSSPAIEQLTNTPIPATPEPTSAPIRDKLVLWTPEGSQAEEIRNLQSLLSEWAGRDSLEMLLVNGLDQQGWGSDIRMVIALSPSQEIQTLAAANPKIQFVAISPELLQPSANLSIIHTQSNRPDREGFAAGYLAAVLTPHWRVGVIGSPEDPKEKARRNGFGNGMIFFCGLCRPSIPPFVQYPISTSLPTTSDAAAIQAAVDPFVVNGVKTVFVSSNSMAPMLLETLAAAGIQIIGLDSPLDSIRDHYVATIGIDFEKELEIIWSKVLAGEGGQMISSDLVIKDVNSALLSTGRLQFVGQMLSDLSAGYIDTGVDPETGDLR